MNLCLYKLLDILKANTLFSKYDREVSLPEVYQLTFLNKIQIFNNNICVKVLEL